VTTVDSTPPEVCRWKVVICPELIDPSATLTAWVALPLTAWWSTERSVEVTVECLVDWNVVWQSGYMAKEIDWEDHLWNVTSKELSLTTPLRQLFGYQLSTTSLSCYGYSGYPGTNLGIRYPSIHQKSEYPGSANYHLYVLKLWNQWQLKCSISVSCWAFGTKIKLCYYKRNDFTLLNVHCINAVCVWNCAALLK